MSVCFEIDFLPVDNGRQGGDAICMRYGHPGCYTVMVYDGGTRRSGKALVRHIRGYYKTNIVDHVVCSHPDADHLSGLGRVLEKMEVKCLWLHRPWAYSSPIGRYVEDGLLSNAIPASRLQENMEAAYVLEQIAKRRGIPVREPFQGQQIGEFTVMSPARDWYVHDLVADMERPFCGLGAGSTRSKDALWKTPSGSVFTGIAESWDTELLDKDARTSSANESSVVLFGMPADRGVLLTGDAGPQALAASAAYAGSRAMAIPELLNFVQVPHHGSRRNVTSSVLDRLIGRRIPGPLSVPGLTAFVSAPAGGAYPRQAVVNAFIRRGARIVATKGKAMSHRFNMDPRPGWVPVRQEGIDRGSKS